MSSTDQEPIPMILTCPSCKERHVDRGVFAMKPHHTHACQRCGMVWRPAIVGTVGVQFLPGFKDDTEAEVKAKLAASRAKGDAKFDASQRATLPDLPGKGAAGAEGDCG